MKKFTNFVLAFIGFVILLSACKSETYTDKLNDEKKAINRFIDENNIEVLNTYPDKHQFAENQYFREPGTGIYIHVIDSGTHEKPTKSPKTDVQFRHDTIYDLLNNKAVAPPNNDNHYYMQFTYGDPSTYSNQNDNFLSQACVLPLDYGLGNRAKVKLIVPFEMGSSAQQYNYTPLYYSQLEYKFIIGNLQNALFAK